MILALKHKKKRKKRKKKILHGYVHTFWKPSQQVKEIKAGADSAAQHESRDSE
jgi:hypothetical protein